MYLSKLLLIWVASFLLFGTSTARVLNILTIDYAPFYSKELKNYGPLTEIIKKSFAKSDIQIIVKFTSWKSAVKQVKEGQADGLFTMWHKKEREEYFTFSKPIYPSELGFVVLKMSPIESARISSIKGASVGVIRGYLMPNEFHAIFSKIKEADNESDNLKRLVAGRIDMVYGNRIELLWEGAKKGYSLKWLYPPYKIHQQHLVLGNHVADRKFLLKKFNQGLNELIESGEYCSILKKSSLNCPK